MITDKSRYGHDVVLDLDCGDSVQVLRTEPMTLTEQEQKIVQKYLGIALLEKSYIDANGHLMVVLSDGRTLDVGSARGLSGATPYLGENGNWFVEGVDTLQSARGLPGFTPYIGENEHWWIDETDTGIPARGIPLTEKADNSRFLRNDGTWQKVTPENIGAAKQSVVADHTARIEALEQRTVTAPYYTDDSVAYIKEVPENALPFASVDMVGGMTRKCTNLWDEQWESGYINLDSGLKKDSATNIRSTNRIHVKPDATYCLSDGSWDGTRIALYDEQGIYTGYISKTPFVTPSNCHYIAFYTEGTSYNNNIILSEGTEPLPYEPYFDGLRSAPVTEAKSVGVNMIPFPYSDGGVGTVKELNGITWVVNSDGSITANGTATASSYIILSRNKVWASADVNGTNTPVSFEGLTFFNCRYNFTNSNLSINIGAGRTVSNVTYYPMINKGTTARPYTPYRSDTLPIPAAVQALDGFGWGVNDKVYNYVDLEKKQFVKWVGRVDMGTLVWMKESARNVYFAHISDGKHYGTNNLGNALCSDYTLSDYVYGEDKVFTFGNNYSSKCALVVRDDDYTDAATFKAAMQGVMLYYELAEPVITDISDLLPDDNLIRVEGGCNVTMVNEYGYDVPSEITYARLTWQ